MLTLWVQAPRFKNHCSNYQRIVKKYATSKLIGEEYEIIKNIWLIQNETKQKRFKKKIKQVRQIENK